MANDINPILGGSYTEGMSIAPGQAPFLQGLWNQANLTSQNPMGSAYSQQFLQPGFNAFNQMAQGGAQIPGLQQAFGNFGTQSNQALGGAIDAGLGQINRNFNQNIMPGINQGAAMAGTSGGSRQGIAQGLAMSQANQQASDFVNRMQSNNWQNQMQNQFAGLQGQAGLQQMQNNAMGQAMSQAPQMQNLGFGSQYGNLNSLASLYGNPVTTGGGSQSSPGLVDMFSFGFGM